MTEFCPRCTAPLESAPDSTQDSGRLCETCGWFGDSSEVLSTPPDPKQFNPVLVITQAIALYQDVCREELLAEQAFNRGRGTLDDIRRVKRACHNAKTALVELFIVPWNQGYKGGL